MSTALVLLTFENDCMQKFKVQVWYSVNTRILFNSIVLVCKRVKCYLFRMTGKSISEFAYRLCSAQ